VDRVDVVNALSERYQLDGIPSWSQPLWSEEHSEASVLEYPDPAQILGEMWTHSAEVANSVCTIASVTR
jgi:hypothetical protein